MSGVLRPYSVRPTDRAPAVTRPIEPDPSLPRACVIGAGSSGLAAAKALHLARVPFDCFEIGSRVGGNWVFENPNGQSACYSTLEINTSCPRMAFSDFPMPEDYPPYARHWEVAAYFEAYVDHFGFRDRITFDTEVTSVRPRAAGGYDVEVRGPGGTATRAYDAVLVCNGHHWDARWPDPAYPGTFDGEQIHAHDYRRPEQLEGRDVLVVGAGNSAMDIAADAAGVARSTTISVRRGQWIFPKYIGGKAVDQNTPPAWVPWAAKRAAAAWLAKRHGDLQAYGLPRPPHHPGESHPVQGDRFVPELAAGRIAAKPGIARLAGDRVEFTDGTSVPAVLIVWATGYRISFPFFDPAFLSAPGNALPLFKRVVHPDHPGVCFIGLLQPLGAVMPLAEAQSAWVAEVLAGRCALPHPEAMRTAAAAADEDMRRRFYASARHTMEVDFDGYLADLARERRRGERRARAAVAA